MENSTCDNRFSLGNLLNLWISPDRVAHRAGYMCHWEWMQGYLRENNLVDDFNEWSKDREYEDSFDYLYEKGWYRVKQFLRKDPNEKPEVFPYKVRIPKWVDTVIYKYATDHGIPYNGYIVNRYD